MAVWLIIGLPRGAWALLPPTQGVFLTARGGVRLFCEGFERKEGFPALVVLHGYGQSSDDFLPLAESLHSKGFSVYLMDLRGHGRSGGDRYNCERFEDYMEDLKTFLSWVKPRLRGAPLFVYGHSLGGIIVLRYGFEHPKDILGFIVSGPELGMYAKLPLFGKVPLPLWVLRAIGPLLNLLAWRLPNAPVPFTGLTPTVRARQAKEVNRGILRLHRGGQNLERPCLILQGNQDGLVPRKAIERFFLRLNAPTKTLILYANLRHNLYSSKSELPILEDMVRWITIQFKSTPGSMANGP